MLLFLVISSGTNRGRSTLSEIYIIKIMM